MKFCQPHWDALRAALDVRGLSALTPDSGEKAAANMAAEIAGEPASIDNFDPLMGAHWAIVGNVDDFLASTGAPPLILWPPDDQHPDRCPMCTIKEVVASFRGPDGICTCGCGKPVPAPELFEEWIDRAADDQVAAWKELRA